MIINNNTNNETFSENTKFSLEENTGDVRLSTTIHDASWSIETQEREYRTSLSRGEKRVLGNSRLLCCCILTKDGLNSVCIAIIVLLVVFVFLFGVVPRGEFVSYAVVLLLTIATLTCLVLSVTVDPGILLPLPSEPRRQSETILVGGKEVHCKVCSTCNILRPPRSTHCQFCDYCVEEFDHHCGVMGSCVAKRTFRFFGGFFLFSSILVLYIGIRSLFALLTSSQELNSNWERWTFTAGVISILSAILSGCVVLPFACYYVYLGCMNSTQKESERLKLGFCEPNHQYHQGYCKNFCLRFFGPLGRSRINMGNANFVV